MFDKNKYIIIANQTETNVIKAAEQLARMSFNSNFAKKILVLKSKKNELQYLIHFQNGINLKQMLFCVNYFKYPRGMPRFGDVRGYMKIMPNDGLSEEFAYNKCMIYCDNAETNFRNIRIAFERSMKTLQLTIGEFDKIKEIEPGGIYYHKEDFISYDFDAIRLINHDEMPGTKGNDRKNYDNVTLLVLAVLNLLLALVPGFGFFTIIGSIALIIFGKRYITARVLGWIAVGIPIVSIYALGFYTMSHKFKGIETSPGYHEENTFEAKANLNKIVYLVEDYKKNAGYYPRSLNVLIHDENTTLYDESFVEKGGFGTKIVYKRVYYRLDDSLRYYLALVGRDGNPGTDDDILPALTKYEADTMGLEKYTILDVEEKE